MEDDPPESPKLILRKITVESNLKFFTLESGRSGGSSLSLEFDVPDGVSRQWVREQTWVEKEKLDQVVATGELAKGTLSRSDFDDWRLRHKKAYDQLLKRSPT